MKKAAIYPDLPGSNHPFFWLAAFFRDVAQLEQIEALEGHAHKLGSGKLCSNGNLAQCHALAGASRTLQDGLKTSLTNLIDDGHLLFAHQGTAVFEGGAA